MYMCVQVNIMCDSLIVHNIILSLIFLPSSEEIQKGG